MSLEKMDQTRLPSYLAAIGYHFLAGPSREVRSSMSR